MKKFQTREEKLRNKISEELTHPKPNLERIVEFTNEFEQANLATIEKLNREKKLDDNKIKGALKQTINAHGPITLELIGSAVKRINGSILVDHNSQTKPCVCKPTYRSEGVEPFAMRGVLLGIMIAGIIYYLITLIF